MDGQPSRFPISKARSSTVAPTGNDEDSEAVEMHGKCDHAQFPECNDAKFNRYVNGEIG